MEECLPSLWQLSTPRSPNFHCVSTPANAMGKQYQGSIFSISAYINNQWKQGKVSYDVCLQIYKLRISG